MDPLLFAAIVVILYAAQGYMLAHRDNPRRPLRRYRRNG